MDRTRPIMIRPASSPSSRALRFQAFLAVVSIFCLAVTSPAAGQETQTPWTVLESLRAGLAATGPQAADFEQRFVPAGFSTGESERGRLALDLPRCLRWDYEQPLPKSFLLCDDLLHYWSPEDRRGQRTTVDRENEPGLDLLLLDTEELALRYSATLDSSVETSEGQGTIVHLIPKSAKSVLSGKGTEEGTAGASPGAITEATFTLNAQGELASLAYTDREGNRTVFLIEDYRPLSTASAFEVPDEIDWTEP